MSRSIRVLALCTIPLLGPTPPATGCVGPPPEPICGKNLTLAVAGPTSTVLTGGGVVDVTALVFLSLLDFPEGLGACPGGPYTADVSVTVACTPGPGASGLVLGAAVGPGFNVVTVPVPVPSGPARHCAVDATATMSLVDGMTLTETAGNVMCVVDPAPGAPSEPRLDLELLGPAGTEIARTHPGDQAAHTWRITNNDKAESFTGGITVDMLNESRMPGMSGPAPEGTGVFSISDPVAGDNFAVAFEDGLFNGCVPLPPDPLDPALPEIWRPVSLGPGQSVNVTIYSRHWGMCADGSCGRSTVTLDGDFSDASPGTACSGFVLAADAGAAPSYGWPDAGEAAEVPEPDDPAEPKVTLGGEPEAGKPAEIDVEVDADLKHDGVPAPLLAVFSDRMNVERGRIQFQFSGLIAADSQIDFDGEVLVTTIPGSLARTEKVTHLDGPTGFESRAPAAEALIRVEGVFTSYFDVSFQVSAVGIDTSFRRVPLDFGAVQFVRRADGSGLDFSLEGGVFTGGTGNDMLAVEVAFDLRGFLSPEPQGAAIFEDGFESGNVSRWSVSTP